MKVACSKEVSINGLHVKSWSGSVSPDRTVCDLKGRTDVKHIVEVTNLRLYDLDVQCSALIVSVPHKAEFRGIGAGISPTSWTLDGAIEENGWYRFDRVELVRRSAGFEKIRVFVATRWAENLGHDRVDLAFNVEA